CGVSDDRGETGPAGLDRAVLAAASPWRAPGMAVPAGRAALRTHRPGAADQRSAAVHDAGHRVEPARRCGLAPARGLRCPRPAVGTDELHERWSPARATAENVTIPPLQGTLMSAPER